MRPNTESINLSPDQLQALQNLDPQHMEAIQNLDPEQIEKLNNMNPQDLMALAAKKDKFKKQFLKAMRVANFVIGCCLIIVGGMRFVTDCVLMAQYVQQAYTVLFGFLVLMASIQPDSLKKYFGFMFTLRDRAIFHFYLTYVVMPQQLLLTGVLEIIETTGGILLLFTAIVYLLAHKYVKGMQSELSKPLDVNV